MNKFIFDIAKKNNIPQEKNCIINSVEDRKKCFELFGKPFFPAEPGSICEAVFTYDFSDYRILIYPDNIKNESEFSRIFGKIAADTLKKSDEYKTKKENGKILLQILADHLHGKKSTDFTATEELMNLAKAHEVQSIVCFQLGEVNTKPYYTAIKLFARREKYLSLITEEFNKADIEFYIVKGGKIFRDYPVPQLRVMGDCDIHLHPADKEKAAEIMKSLGFEIQIIKNCFEWKCLKNGLTFELHHSLYYDDLKIGKKEINFLLSEWNYVHNNELEPEFHFIYLLSHLKKHLTNVGVGFRQFMDLTVEIITGKLDIEKVIQYAEKAGLKDFLLVCLSLCEKWFDFDMPVKAELTEEFTEEATFRVLNNGVFGFNKTRDENREYAKLVNYDGRIKTFITSVFMPYKSFLTDDEYSWLKGKPFLLPFAWIIRIIRKATNTEARKKSLYNLNRVVTAQNTDKEFSEWGL